MRQQSLVLTFAYDGTAYAWGLPSRRTSMSSRFKASSNGRLQPTFGIPSRRCARGVPMRVCMRSGKSCHACSMRSNLRASRHRALSSRSTHSRLMTLLSSPCVLMCPRFLLASMPRVASIGIAS